MAPNPTTAVAHRCDATIGRTAGDFGFVPVTCSQTVGVATFVSTSGLRIGYCAREGHETSVRRRFAERVESTEGTPAVVGGCGNCVDLARGGSGPAHEASPRCESGRRAHCSCDVCW